MNCVVDRGEQQQQRVRKWACSSKMSIRDWKGERWGTWCWNSDFLT